MGRNVMATRFLHAFVPVLAAAAAAVSPGWNQARAQDTQAPDDVSQEPYFQANSAMEASSAPSTQAPAVGVSAPAPDRHFHLGTEVGLSSLLTYDPMSDTDTRESHVSASLNLDARYKFVFARANATLRTSQKNLALDEAVVGLANTVGTSAEAGRSKARSAVSYGTDLNASSFLDLHSVDGVRLEQTFGAYESPFSVNFAVHAAKALPGFESLPETDAPPKLQKGNGALIGSVGLNYYWLSLTASFGHEPESTEDISQDEGVRSDPATEGAAPSEGNNRLPLASERVRPRTEIAEFSLGLEDLRWRVGGFYSRRSVDDADLRTPTGDQNATAQDGFLPNATHTETVGGHEPGPVRYPGSPEFRDGNDAEENRAVFLYPTEIFGGGATINTRVLGVEDLFFEEGQFFLSGAADRSNIPEGGSIDVAAASVGYSMRFLTASATASLARFNTPYEEQGRFSAFDSDARTTYLLSLKLRSP